MKTNNDRKTNESQKQYRQFLNTLRENEKRGQKFERKDLDNMRRGLETIRDNVKKTQ